MVGIWGDNPADDSRRGPTAEEKTAVAHPHWGKPRVWIGCGVDMLN